MRAPIPRLAACALATFLVAAANEPTATVTVDGVPLTYRDVLQLSALSLAGAGVMQTGVAKQSSEMPAASPYVYYAGTDAGGKPIVWISTAIRSGAKLSDAQTAEMEREGEAAGLLAALAASKGDAPIQRLYTQAKNDPAELASLGAALTGAMTQMSALTVQYSNEQRRWIFQNIPAGTTRTRVEEMLQGHGLVADTKGNTMVVSLPGAFQPGCYFSTNVTLTFSDRMQVYKIDLSPAIPDCL